jgi:predicted ATPase/DNA-binding SARP family transcriptional activator
MKKKISAAFLGGFQVFRGSQPVVGFGYDKVRALFAYLAVEDCILFNRVLLAGLFWPEHSQEKAYHSLRQAVLRLRSTIQDDHPLFFIHRKGIERNPLANFLTDVMQFESLIRGYSIGEKKDITLLESAVELYQGEFLKGLSLAGAEAFEEWLFNRREYFHRQVVSAVEKIVVHHERLLNLETARLYVEKLLNLEPWREEAHRKLMLLLARLGQRSAALRQYELCRQVLLARLDLLPDEETDSLYRRIREMHFIENPGFEITTPLIGRDSELSQLKKMLSDPYTRLVTITGPGGIGKTRLALQLLKDMYGSDIRLFLNGVMFLELSGVNSIERFLSYLVEAFHLSLIKDTDQIHQIIHYLKDKELLIILDNFEQLINKEVLDFITNLLRETHNVKLVATSRHKLNLNSEVVLSLKGLTFPDPTQPVRLKNLPEQRYGAVDFFLRRIKQARPGLIMQEEDTLAVIRLCQMVEGLPLALLLAASWADSLSLAEIAAEVKGNLDFLRVEWQDLSERHRSMHAALNVSWNLLRQEERQIFSYLSVFNGGFSSEAALAVAGASKVVISSLVNKSILNYDLDKHHYSLHELLRQYGSEKLAENDPQKKELQDRHSQYFCQYMRNHFAIHDRKDEKGVLHDLEREFDNYQAAWKNACEQGREGEIQDLAGGLHFVFTRKARYTEGTELFEYALNHLSGQESSNPLHTARITAYLGDLAALAGNWEKGRDLLKHALDAAENTITHEKSALELKAFILSRLGAFTPSAEEAKKYLDRSLALLRQSGDKRQAAFVLGKLGDLTRITGDLEVAKKLLEESLRLQETAISSEKVNTMVVLGLHALRTGDLEKSESLLREAANLAHLQDDKERLADALEAKGMGSVYSGKFQEAVPLFKQSLGIRQELGQKARISKCNAFIGLTKLHEGQSKQAKMFAHQAFSVAVETGDSPTIATSLWARGAALLDAGDLDISKESLLESISFFRSGWQQDWHSRRGMVYSYLSCLESCKGEFLASEGYLKLGLQHILEYRSYIGLLHCLAFGARLLYKKGEEEKSGEIYSLVKMQPFVKNSVFFERMVGRIFFPQFPASEKQGIDGMQVGVIENLWKAGLSLDNLLG